jgi:hypothetical protein
MLEFAGRGRIVMEAGGRERRGARAQSHCAAILRGQRGHVWAE